MRALLAIAIALAACGDGIFIEVDTTLVPGGDRVEIITTKKLCELPFAPDVKCDHMQGEGFDRAFGNAGDIFTRHRAGSIAIDGAGFAVFEVEPGFGVLPMVFAIARDVQGAPVGVAAMEGTIDTDAGAILYRVTLDPAEDFRSKSRDISLAGFAEWGVDTGHDCIGVEPISPDPRRGKVFIVPEDNPDCDAQRDDTECDPLWFDGFAFDELRADTRHCVVRSTKIDSMGVTIDLPCVLGHLPVCAENPSLEEPCLEQRAFDTLCLPGDLCDPNGVCPDRDDAVCHEAALLGGAASGLVPQVLCEPPGVDDVDITPCAEPTMVIARPVSFTLPVTCSNVELTGLDLPFHAVRSDRVIESGATFKIETFGEDCTTHLTWSGQIPVDTAVHTTLVFTIETGEETRQLMFPMVFRPLVGCSASGNAAPCQLIPADSTDSIFSCLQ